jgi:hypothetical protein
MALLSEVCMDLILRMMVLLFWITYNCSSGNLMLLHEILPQVMARKPLILLLRVSMFLSKYRTYVLQYKLVTWKCSCFQ